ncbi:NfeD family protein [Nocardioides sp. KIGAM211]|uniref:NfeD family protein n=1 Tax=Nocardioides luti TaxID=2761101 RepID=A0A7X0RF81_9ACTN|nr:NfeD family protein [Nocardioides luti]MBB6625909.1 NfeD family protein [Nocardioides luti]
MDWLRDNAWEAWLGLAIVLGVAEMFSLDLILIMLAVGALAGMVTAAFDAHLVVQVLVAAGASIGALALVRPDLVKKFHSGPDLKLGHGKLVGQQGLVTEEVTALTHGRIKLGGEIWSAAPYDDTIAIAPGETVEVLQIKGATAYVHPIPRLDP